MGSRITLFNGPIKTRISRVKELRLFSLTLAIKTHPIMKDYKRKFKGENYGK